MLSASKRTRQCLWTVCALSFLSGAECHAREDLFSNLNDDEKIVLKAFKENHAQTIISESNEHPNDAKIQYFAGLMYYEGQIVHKNPAKSFTLLLGAARSGLPEAQTLVAILYFRGDGTVENWTEAVRWYQEAAAQGDATAQLQLGILYRNGYGVKKDFSLALKWFSQAASQGQAEAIRELGNLYYDGAGVRKDPDQATMYYKRAASLGDKDSIKYLKRTPKPPATSRLRVNGATIIVCGNHAINTTGKYSGPEFQETFNQCIVDMNHGHDFHRPQRF